MPFSSPGRALRLLLALSLAPALLAPTCEGDTSDPEAGEPVAVFELPRDPAMPFFDLPWPNDLRRTEEGFIDVRAFPNPRRVELLDTYREVMSTRLTGFSVSAPVYLRFGTSVDLASLPATPAATLEPGASVYLVDVDPESPTRGERRPVEVRYWAPQTSYWPGHALAVRPVHGMPLAGDTTYAVVVTDGVEALDGRRLRRSPDLTAILEPGRAADDFVEDARAVYAPALEVLDEAGVERDAILHLTVFTTQDPTGELLAARDWLAEQPAPEPIDDAWRWVEDTETYTLVHGAYPSPLFQSGEVPYTTEGGELTLGPDGVPETHGSYDARFALTVPRTEMPEDGYPLVLVAHGTGGDYETFVRGGTAEALASIGFAAMGVDQIHHGTRNPTASGPEGLVFNFLNPFAFRDNARQAALDVVQQARFAVANPVSDRIIASDPPVRFDPERIYFFGHSQGGLNGPIFLAIDDTAKGGVLSGAGGHLAIALVEKTEPLDIPDLVRLLLRVNNAELEDEHLTYEHPVFALLQTWTDVADPTNYVHMLFERPREGFAPKSILQTEGITDAYTPPRSIEALAVSAGIPLVGRELQPIPALELLDLGRVDGPVSGNVAGGEATAGLLQYDGGHFVAYGEDAQARILDFYTSFEDGLPTIR